jgi:hypothetical protein
MCYGFKGYVKTTFWNCYVKLIRREYEGKLSFELCKEIYNSVSYSANRIENKSYCYSVLKEIQK